MIKFLIAAAALIVGLLAKPVGMMVVRYFWATEIERTAPRPGREWNDRNETKIKN